MKKITVIGDNGKVDLVNFANGLVRANEIYMTDVASMVVRVIAQADGDKIIRLNILDHGNPTGGRFGKDWVSYDTFGDFSSHFAKLRPCFNEYGSVHLLHCDIGRNEDLLRVLASTLNVPVYAGTGTQNSLYDFNGGHYVRCNPSGMIYHNIPRPYQG